MILKKFETIPFLGDFIDGEFIKATRANGTFEKRDPGDTTQVVIDCTYQFDHVNGACDAAKKAFRPWADLGLEKRRDYILRLKEAYIGGADELAVIISRETGKPQWE